MKKIVSFVLCTLLCLGVSFSTCYAEETSQPIFGKEVVSEMPTDVAQPMLTNNYEYNGYVRLTLSNEFTTSEKGNLHLTISSSANCRIVVYQKSLFGWINIFSTNHSGTQNYTVKNNAPKGTYKYEIYTDDYNCYVSMIFSTAQYI